MKFKNWIYIILSAVVMSCGNKENKYVSEAETVVDSFATAYFNYDFNGAMRYVDEDSKKWLRYMASNVKQEDIDILRSMDGCADITIDSSDIAGKRLVYITVSNFLYPDTIGKAGHIVNGAQFSIPVTQSGGKWRIRMEGPLQSGN